MQKLMPNFFIIGAEKGGTTSLYYYLKEHPEIFMSPEKEPFFFICENGFPEILGNKIQDDRFIRTRIQKLEEYEKLFEGVKNETAIGEASASYLYVKDTAIKIKNYIKNPKLIVILRQPAERAYSNFLHCIGRGVEPITDFDKVLLEEEKRIKENWGLVFYYKEKGFYYKYLKNFYDIFTPEQIKVILYDDFKSNPETVLKEIFIFLNVNKNFTPLSLVKHNVSPNHSLKDNLLTNILRSKNPVKLFLKDFIPEGIKNIIIKLIHNKNSNPVLPMSIETKKQLTKEYEEDILKLQYLIGKDLSRWFL